MITQTELKDRLAYNHKTGIFTWVDGRLVGEEAGCLHSYGYICIRINGKQHKAHRLAYLYMMGEWPFGDLDHKNRIKHDNRWLNIRNATEACNAMNQGMLPKNTSGYKGVSWSESHKKWLVSCSVNCKRYFLGAFDDPELGGNVYQVFAREHHEEFYAGAME